MTDVSTPETLFSWIHLADLHIGRVGGRHGWDRQLVLDALRTDIASCRDYGVPAPDAIFVTGDIARSGAMEEYASARDWLLGVAGSVGLGPDRVFVVPGNHDVDRTADRDNATIRLVQSLRAGSEQLDVVLQDPADRARLAARLSHYLSFAEGFAPGCLGARSSDDQALFWAHGFDARGGLRVRLLGLNTTLLSVDDTDQGKLRLGTEQIDRGLRSPPIERGELVIALSHHPLHGGWLADEENASGWIHSRAHIHMHGQVYDGGSESIRSGGGGGLVRMAVGAGPSYGYSFDAIGVRQGRVDLRSWPRAWSEKKKRFVVGVDSTPEGRPFAEHTLRVDLGAHAESPRAPLPATALFEGPGAMPALPVPNFLGRSADLDALRRALGSESDAVCIVASGIGGIGKTTLARQFVATEAAQFFADGVAWIDATALPSELRRVAQRFGWNSEHQPTVEEANRWLAVKLHNRPVLLVIDNVNPVLVDARDIPVPGGRSRTLITTRSISLHEDLGKQAETIPLGKWSDATCREYLRSVTKRDDLREDARLDELAYFVGNLPLAIRLMAKLLTQGGPPERLLARIKEQPLGTLDSVARGADRGVAQTFVTAFQGLPENEQRVLLALSVCARNTRAEVVAHVAGVSEATAEQTLSELAEHRSLVERDPFAAHPWGLHDVVRLFLREQGGARRAMREHDEYLAAHLATHQEERDWESVERIIPEVLESFARTIVDRQPDQALEMLSLVQRHLIRIGRYRDYLRVLESVDEILDASDPRRAIVLRDIGISLRFLGRHQDAINALAQSMALDKKNNVMSRRGSSLSEIAACYRAQGRFAEALDLAKRAVGLIDRTEERGAYGIAVSVVGLCYRDMLQPEHAIEWLEESLRLNQTMGNAQGEAIQLGNLAACHVARGDTASAMSRYKLALEIDVQIGLTEPEAKHRSGLGVCLFNIGDYVGALSQFEKALDIFEKLSLPAQELVQLGRIANTHRASGDLQKAEFFGRLAHERSKTVSSVQPGGSMVESAGGFRLRSATVARMRSIDTVTWGSAAASRCGWHVVLGENGAGKSSFLRAVALALVGPSEAGRLSEDLARWIRKDAPTADVSIILEGQSSQTIASRGSNDLSLTDIVEDYRLKLDVKVAQPELSGLVSVVESGAAAREDWNRDGFFSASYGPFRRFADGDAEYERLLSGQPRRARHISLFDSGIALTESLAFLRDLHHKKLERKGKEGKFLDSFTAIANDPGPPFFLPHGMQLAEISSSGVTMKDGNGFDIPIEDLSDGYRAVLSLTFDLIRHMANAFGYDRLFDPSNPTVILPGGIVLIDEIDAHLHPTWQRQIGLWFKRHFPNVQFIVTTHSPLVCQTADSIFVLPAPGSDEEPRMLEQEELDRIRYGNVLDAYGTGAFGVGVTRSEKSKEMRKRLVALNRKEADIGLSPEEQEEQQQLRAVMPSAVSALGSDSREGAT
ncbi:MAG: tetratricopeptide repeat protein [Byssovorax sp.]